MKTATKNAAVYARYSTDMQNDKSIDDQVGLCQQIATTNGFKIDRNLIFSDRAKSSASMFDRDGLLALMTSAKKRGFDAVICESLDRLSRDQEDLPGIYKRLRFNDIKIITSDGEANDVQVGIRGIVGTMFLKDLGNKVRRHHDARAREGLVPGALTYGYRSLAGGRKGEREIDPKEAKVVRRIFEEYVSGKSSREIALGLTRDGIPTPSGKKDWDSGTFTHGRGDSRGMIGNRLYIGTAIWNDYTTVLNPDTGKRVRRKNDASKVITTEVPHLRIIPQDLWDRAHALNKSRAERSFGKGGRRPAVKNTTESLIAGLLVCGDCGGHMRLVKSSSARSGAVGQVGSRVACAAASSIGTCDHRKSYDLKTLELTVLEGVKKHLTSPEALTEYTKEYHARWAQRQKMASTELRDAQSELNRVTVSIDRVVTAITEVGASPALVAKMKKLETERAGLENKVDHVKAETNVITLHPAAIKKFAADVKAMHKALTTGLLDDEALTPFRVAFRNVFDRITVHPTGLRKPYEVTPLARLSAIMGAELFPKMRNTSEMLAEQGFYAVPERGGTSSLGPANWNRREGLISLGRWKAAA